MTGLPIVTHFPILRNHLRHALRTSRWPRQADLCTLLTHPQRPLKWVSRSPSALRILDLLGPLPWHGFPDRNLQRNWGQPTVPYAAFAAACLLQRNEHLLHMSDLRTYLVEHPAFIWLFGFPLVSSRASPHGFDPDASLPTQRHFTRLLRTIPNATLQFLFAGSVAAVLQALATAQCTAMAQAISLDTKHIIA